MTWLREILSDGKTGRLSSTRATASLAGLSLSLSTVWLSIASFWQPALVPAVVALGSTLGVMATGNYMMMKHSGKTDERKPAA